MTNENRTPAGVPTGGQFAASAKSESGLSLDGYVTHHEQPFTPVGDCPDCGESMVGHVGNGKFVPGAACEHCHHEVANHAWEVGPLSPALTFHTATLDETGYIRVDEDDEMVEIISPSSPEWPRLVREQGFDPLSLQRALLAVNDRHRFVEEETRRFNQPHLAGVYSVLLDRERVPEAAILARVTDPHAMSADDEAIESAIDRLYVGADCSEENVYDLNDEQWAHVQASCDDAGLGVMTGIYESMRDREILHRDQVKDAETVTQDYWNVVGPAIDRIEDALIDEHGEMN